MPAFHGAAIERGRGFGGVLDGFLRNIILPTAKTIGKSLLRTEARKATGVSRKAAIAGTEDEVALVISCSTRYSDKLIFILMENWFLRHTRDTPTWHTSKNCSNMTKT